MPIPLAQWIVGLALAYLGVGAVFAVAFTLVGAKRIDPVAASGTIGFRLLILPGATALWPLLLLRWRRGKGTPPEECNAHRQAARDAEEREDGA